VLERYGVRLVPESVARLLERSIDWTDAAFAATLALLKWHGHATPVGDPAGVEGAIVVSAVRVPPRVVALA
jgi:hypothetical protein